MQSEELFGEPHGRGMDCVAIHTGRVDAPRRHGSTPGRSAIRGKDVMSDPAGEDRQLGMRDMRGIKSRVVADRCGRVAGAIANTARTRGSR